MKIKELAKKINLHVKIVVSTKEFDNYNSFFNIYSEVEEPCRRILLLTPYEDLEEVNDINPSEQICKYRIFDNNIWLKEYPLTVNPLNINVDEISIEDEIVCEIINRYKEISK